MESYQNSSEGFEPSADELIDVLKNLENLAAANPALYRAIVDQIKVHQPSQRHQQGNEQHYVSHQDQESQLNGHKEDYEEQTCYEEYHSNGLDELDREPESYDMDQSQQADVEAFQRSHEEIEKESYLRQQQQNQSEEEERIRQLKFRKQRTPEPAKIITVVAGSRNQAAWPIAPGIDNGTVPRTIELTAGSAESEEEMIRHRLQIAEAAGLRHVEVIHGDEDFYPQPIKDYDYPWAGSLRPVSNRLHRREVHRRGSDVDPVPWAGSLRHVEEKKRRPKPKPDDDLYGDAPWMGTLRHVKNENKVLAINRPQFKRYPDEDAPNPYSSTQGKSAKPCYPLTPAAVISACGGSKEERERAQQDEEVERIRSHLRETRTVSNSLLRALMPKLLKEHESKHEALDHMESIRIMEEVLGMQIGLSTQAIDDDNDEADEIIRAIMQGDGNVYNKIADDIEKAAQLKRKGKVGDKKKKKKPTSKASTKELAPELEAN